MVFCIDQDKCDKLSDYLSQIVKIIKECKEVDALIMNSYLIHIPVNSIFDCGLLKDGINIKLTLICNSEKKTIEENVKSLKSKIIDELNYNVIISTMPSKFLNMRTGALRHYLNDAEILFDHTKEVTTAKNLIFLESKSEDVIEYQPSLNIRS